MFTEILTPQQVHLAAAYLKKGQVIAFPTETVYGLGAALFNPEAAAEIFALKGRPADNPLIAHISDLSQIAHIGRDIPPLFYVLAEAFCPGPFTMVLKKHPAVPSIVSGGMDTIAVRMPQHPVAHALITAVGQPLVAPSANLSGRPSATTCAHVLEDFQDKIAAVIDGGRTEFGIESTVLSLLHEPPMLLRPGSVTRAQIEHVLKCEISVADPNIKEKALSPGMKYRHYAPKTPMQLVFSEEQLLGAIDKEGHPMVLTRYHTLALPKGEHFTLSAKELYALLRYADAQRYTCICVLCDETLMQDGALANRLMRASGVV
jgi:L-threonylcarbamoyladenylate synthase